jgi:hypothetical protein
MAEEQSEYITYNLIDLLTPKPITVSILRKTLDVSLEAIKLVYQYNIAHLQAIGREKEYTEAIDEIQKILGGEK